MASPMAVLNTNLGPRGIVVSEMSSSSLDIILASSIAAGVIVLVILTYMAWRLLLGHNLADIIKLRRQRQIQTIEDDSEPWLGAPIAIERTQRFSVRSHRHSMWSVHGGKARQPSRNGPLSSNAGPVLPQEQVSGQSLTRPDVIRQSTRTRTKMGHVAVPDDYPQSPDPTTMQSFLIDAVTTSGRPVAEMAQIQRDGMPSMSQIPASAKNGISMPTKPAPALHGGIISSMNGMGAGLRRIQSAEGEDAEASWISLDSPEPGRFRFMNEDRSAEDILAPYPNTDRLAGRSSSSINRPNKPRHSLSTSSRLTHSRVKSLTHIIRQKNEEKSRDGQTQP